LVEKNVTIVTLNYRLGVYGFLSLNDSSLNVPGNAGLKDQRLALKWVQQNIANFGGDPNQVTLFGLSAGGGSTHYHMLSENSRGLFHKAIAMGSNALQNIGRIFPSANWAQVLSQRLGFTGDLSSDHEVLQFLETADPIQVTLITPTLIPVIEILNDSSFPFGPTLEPYETEGGFINANVFDLIEDPWSNEIPLLIGQTSMESIGFISDLRSDAELFSGFTNFENFIPFELGVKRNTEKSKKYAEMIRKVHYPVFKPTVTNIDGLIFVSV
jgi:cholinesterase